MPSKNAPDDLISEGFSPEEFGEDASSWSAYAQAVLDEQSIVVLSRVGAANYASTDVVLAMHVKLAERYLASAELWLRRMNNVETDVVLGGGPDNKANHFQRFQTNHQTYLNKAKAEIAALPAVQFTPMDATSKPSFGGVVTSTFEVLP